MSSFLKSTFHKKTSTIKSIVVTAKKKTLPLTLIPKAGDAVGSWRSKTRHDFTGWVMGEKVKDFSELKPGEYYLSDSEFLDRVELVKFEKFGYHNQTVGPEYAQGIHMIPVDPETEQSIEFLNRALFKNDFSGESGQSVESVPKNNYAQTFYGVRKA